MNKEFCSKNNIREQTTFESGVNSLITEPVGHERRIDYVFAIDNYKFSNDETITEFMPLEAEKFDIERQDRGK